MAVSPAWVRNRCSQLYFMIALKYKIDYLSFKLFACPKAWVIHCDSCVNTFMLIGKPVLTFLLSRFVVILVLNLRSELLLVFHKPDRS